MKKIIALLVLLTSLTSFAETQDCKRLSGNYTCNYNNQIISLKITTKASSLILDLAGETDEFTVDGILHNSKRDDSQNIASCKDNKELVVDNYFHDELKGSFSILLTSNGVLYTLAKEFTTLELTCKRN